LKLEVIRDLAELIKAEPEWSSFTSSIAGLTPFQLPAWLLTWWRHFGSGELRVVVFREKGSIVGVGPLFLHAWNGARQMTLIGSGISDYLEPAIHPHFVEEVVNRLRYYLESESEWEVCNWQDLSFDTALRELSSHKLEAKAIDETECREVRLSGTFAEYWNARSASLRQNVRRDRAKAESMGSVRFEATSEADTELMNALVRLHGARWQAQGQIGTIATNSSADFLREIARKFAARNMLRLFSLHLSENIAAVIFAFQHADKIFNYLTAFDPQYDRLGVGRTLLFEALRYCLENGYHAWDFLRGGEPYKEWWGAEKIPKCRLIIRRR
jgi:CelD/BcsL family acetyltransferase involved in cellulose biosynthesis